MSRSTPRFILASLLVAAAAIFLQARTRNEVFPSRLPLKQFPAQVGDWLGTNDVALDKDVLDILGPGDFLLRVYKNQDNPPRFLDLFIAYLPSQRTGDTLHSPKNCLPGAGWAPVDQSRITLSVPGHDPFPANRYIIAKGDSREVVLYWYWAHDRGVASEYEAKFYLVADSIRMSRSDGSLIRLITPIYPGESADNAQQRLLPFAQSLVPMLKNYIPR
jgi:EpsI family protein